MTTRPIILGGGDDLLKALLGGAQLTAKTEPISDDVEARVLLDLLSDIREPLSRLQVGDLVRQREAFDCYTFGRRLCVVSHIFPAPYLDHTTPTAELRNDLLILVRVGQEARPQEFAVQSWRFERYVGPISR